MRSNLFFALLISIGGISICGSANAMGDRNALREAAGRYDGKFFGKLKQPGSEAKAVAARGFIRVPVGKGKGLLALKNKRVKSSLPVRFQKAMVRQGGRKVIYRGKNAIRTPNHGILAGPFEAMVSLKGTNRIATRTKIKNAQGTIIGSFKGSDEELQ